MDSFSVTRQEIVDAARSLLGTPFVHQGRTARGVDCVGLLVLVGQMIDYPKIVDLKTYKRVPSASVLENLLSQNADEISLDSIGIGDFILMRIPGGLKPRHVAVVSENDSMIHALNNGYVQKVVEQPQRTYRDWFVKGFRVRGLI
jgi:cell wall-associated NlpC family hydrolase